jgi:hypothetical protein
LGATFDCAFFVKKISKNTHQNCVYILANPLNIYLALIAYVFIYQNHICLILRLVLLNLSDQYSLTFYYMKKFNHLLLLCAVATLLTVSCGKDGAVGPSGPTGTQGAVGPAGPAGANGQNGSVIYSGSTAPAGTTGTVGDFYINLATSTLYGPKTSAGWGTGISLKGNTGATGTAGSKIFSGNGAPASTVGAAGDFYLDKTNFRLYGPKVGTSWGTPLSLRGPAGPQGPAGNANVKTDVFTVAANQWNTTNLGNYMLETGSGGFTEYFMQTYLRINNTVTQDVLDNGMVLVYFTPSPANNPNQWAPLPYMFPSFGTQYYTNFVYITAPGQVTLGFFFSNINPAATPPSIFTFVTTQDYKFKIVTVTGETGTFMMNNHINLKDYDAVSKATGLWMQDKLSK